ncbi:MAG: alkaline phosphatase D family protein [Saprospiraceae bacterium]|nr:alkaline phosphatase family protein [Saprospiraceae bacterium]MDW8230476.1 alkaline phosphatase D family protein [Saprospiraceae bacterium]
MMRSLALCRFSALLVLWLATFGHFSFAQHPLLQSGPMLGYADMKEVLLWAQTKQAATVYFEYWDKEKPSERFATDAVTTQKSTGYTAKCVADRVEPGRTYGYQLYINREAVTLPYPTEFKTQPLWRWRTDPPTFTVAAGSCAYINEERYDRPGRPYGSNYEIFNAIAAQKPDLMIWLGDNTYLREPDWGTRTGMLHRFTHDRSIPELQPLLATANHYAIWDDHDFGPNDSDGTWINKDIAWEVFQAFWGNPTAGLPGQKGCTTQFQYADVDFFLLDNRYFRTPNNCKTCPCTVLGKEQFDWLRGALAASLAPYKVVAMGGQFLNTHAAYETYVNLCSAERDSLLAFIERENIRGVIFLTGDRHHTELSAYKNARGNWIYDLTSSPLTSGVHTGAASETNKNRVDGTLVMQHNFALLRFSGPRTRRQVEITILSNEGAVLWKRTILPNGELAQE